MNAAEIAEIRKQFKKDSNLITRIVGCYVDGEKAIKCVQKDAFYALAEEDAFKYEEIFRKSLSGVPGRNLLSLDVKGSAAEEGGAGDFLYRLRQSALEDDALLEQFFQKVISSYDYPENYFIILIDLVYDIPRKTSDRQLLEDGGEEVYHGLLCSICPVKLSKAGLGYNAVKNSIENRIRDWIVDAPMQAFLFPRFRDRSTDIHGVLYYSKKSDELMPDFIAEMFDAKAPLSAGKQKESVLSSLQQAAGEDLNVEVLTRVYENLTRMLQEHDESEEPLRLQKADMLKVLEESGADSACIERYERNEEADTEVLAKNIADSKKLEMKRPGISIKVETEYAHLVESKVVDGRKCLVIAADDGVEINGIQVRTL